MGQVTVFAGSERRRVWDDAEKIALLARAFAPGAVLAHVARAADVHPSQLYRWRKEFGFTPDGGTQGFAQVVVQPDPPEVARRACAIRVCLNGAEVEIGEHAPLPLATAVLQALSR